jgi:hypothetical protein
METVQGYKICSMPSNALPKRIAEVELIWESPFGQFPRSHLAAKFFCQYTDLDSVPYSML